MRNAKGNERIIDAKKCDYIPFLGAKKIRISLIYGAKKNNFRTFASERQPHTE